MVDPKRGDIWWAALPEPVGSGPGYRRPVVIVQSNEFNRSRLATVIVAVVTKSVDLASAPGNVLCRRRETGLRLDSVVNVSAVLTIDRSLLLERVGSLATRALQRVDAGLRIALGL
mgnify:CR=1 FL=1